VEDEFSERAMREMVGQMILTYLREKPFLKAVTSPEWATLDGLVATLDMADYWRGEGWSNISPAPEPPTTPAGKRRHVREMLESLSMYQHEDPPTAVEKVLVSKLRATEDGGLERVFKVAALCSPEEFGELKEYNEAAADYHYIRERELDDAHRALERGEGGINLPEFYLEELSEETMDWVWPNIEEEGRRWIIAVGIMLDWAKDRLRKQTNHEHKEGALPTEEQVDEHLRRGVEEMWREIALDLSNRLEMSEDEATRFVDQPAIRTYSPEFAEALDNWRDDECGWTLDEHLRFVEDERELD